MGNILIALEAIYAISTLIQNSSIALNSVMITIQKARSEGRDLSSEELTEVMSATDALETEVLALLKKAAEND